MTKLFIGGFPLDMKEMGIVQLLAPFADVVTIKLVYNRATKICKGYGFIEVPNETQAHQAIDNLNGQRIGDRELSLNIVRETAPKPASQYHKVKKGSVDDKPKRPRRARI